VLACSQLDGSRQTALGFDDDARRVLFEATSPVPRLQAVIARAKPHPEVGGLFVLRATFDELDEMYDFVGALMDSTRSRRRLEMLDGLLGSICIAIDGF
jgi:hypothetical protein